MSVEHKVTYCRICEPLCGLVATVDLNGIPVRLESVEVTVGVGGVG